MHSGPLGSPPCRYDRQRRLNPSGSNGTRRRESGTALVEIDYRTLTVGTRLPEAAFETDNRSIAAYREAVEDDENADGTVPPMAVAAGATGALSRIMSLPFGAIHISQELSFRKAVAVGDKLTCSGELISRRDRRDFHLLTFRLTVRDGRGRRVLSAKTGLLLPRALTGEQAGEKTDERARALERGQTADRGESDPCTP